MAGAALQISHDFDEIKAVFAQLIELGTDTQEMFTEIGDELVSSTLDRFNQSIAPDGTGWQVSQRAKDKGGKTLIKSTQLMQSITRNASADELEVGTDKKYGAIHQFGGEAGRNHAVTLPARPYLGISDLDAQMVEEVALDYIERAFKQ